MSKRTDNTHNRNNRAMRTMTREVVAAQAQAAQRMLDMLERGASYREARGCTGKKQYLSRRDAKRAAAEQPWRDLEEYKCPHCTLFHLASAANSRRHR